MMGNYEIKEKPEEFDISEFDESEFDELDFDESEFGKSESTKSKFDKSESKVSYDRDEESRNEKVHDDKIKKETEEDELMTILTDFDRFEAALTTVNPVVPPKATNLHKHLDELANLLALPLETLLQPANLTRLQNIIKLLKTLPLVDAKLCEWCDTLLEAILVMPKERIGIQKVLMETEAKAQAIVQLQKEATDIRKATLQDLKLKKEYSTSIQHIDVKIGNLKRQLVDAEAERATLIQLDEDLAAAKHQRLKRARIVRDDLAPLIEQNAAINKIIRDSKNAIENIDYYLSVLIVEFYVLKNALTDV